MYFKKTLSILLCTAFLTVPISTNAQEKSNSTLEDIEYGLEEKLSKVNTLLEKDVGIEFNSRENFFNEVNQIHIEIEDYLKSLDSDNFYNTQVHIELIDKLGELDLKVEQYSNKNMLRASKSWRYGDILYYGIGNNNAAGDKSLTGHTAVLSTKDYFVIEAARTKNNGAKVFHWNRDKLWSGASGIKQYKVTTKLGKDATATERNKAVQFGLEQKGEPYALKTSIWSTNAWYCSKLTNAMWNHVGYNLQSSNAYTIDGVIAVLPRDIIADANVRLIKNWGKTLPGNL
ncbi:hypothetical protein AN960_00405 [Bacillus sp. FJAT-25509]|uniref:YiiX/YebB-like N1pC/P60 family cysteine hydrolase n=1 Tax=Bacillaceae TaxID=186817 RepID=UPI0006F31BF9|nr:YiiX/YebB-like N1pC/P60 family cysteine hydrolase [Bacillus sp. FJAT-25509]KQL42458.1 hypothetical protein AN960_00405 [Bacillus sp. FJAT-25509]